MANKEVFIVQGDPREVPNRGRRGIMTIECKTNDVKTVLRCLKTSELGAVLQVHCQHLGLDEDDYRIKYNNVRPGTRHWNLYWRHVAHCKHFGSSSFHSLLAGENSSKSAQVSTARYTPAARFWSFFGWQRNFLRPGGARLGRLYWRDEDRG